VLVRANTATTLEFVGAIFVVPAAGDQFVVERPSVTLQWSRFVVWSGSGTQMVWQGIKYQGTAAQAGMRYEIGKLFLDSCELDLGGGSFQSGQGALVSGGTNGTNSPYLDPTTRLLSCVYVHGGNAFSGFSAPIGEMNLISAVVREGLFAVRNRGRIQINYLDFADGTMLAVAEGGHLRIAGDPAYPSRIRAMAGSGLTIDERGLADLVDGLEISGCAAHGVSLDLGAFAVLQNVIGAGNGGNGIRVQRMSQCEVLGGVTVTGSAPGVNDVMLGGTVPVVLSYAALAIAVEVEAPPSGCFIRQG
jgi:hypothetical protein